MDNWLAIFVFFFLCFVSTSTVCLSIQCASFMHMLRLFFSVFGEFQAPYRLEYELQRVESFTMDLFGRSYPETIPRKTGEKNHHFDTCGHGPTLTWDSHLVFIQNTMTNPNYKVLVILTSLTGWGPSGLNLFHSDPLLLKLTMLTEGIKAISYTRNKTKPEAQV